MSEGIILSGEDYDLVQMLDYLKEGDWAKVVYGLSGSAKAELRSLIGGMIAEFHGQEEEGPTK